MANQASQGYAKAYPQDYRPDARQRGRVSIAHVLPASKAGVLRGKTRGLPADLIFSTVLAQFILCLSLHLVKEWLLSSGGRAPVVAVNVRLLGIATVLLGAWYRPWRLSGMRIKSPLLLVYGALVCAESLAFLTAVDQLPVLRVIMLTQTSELWTYGLQAMRRPNAAIARNANFVALATTGAAYVAEIYLNRELTRAAVNTGYLAIAAFLTVSATRRDLSLSLVPQEASPSPDKSDVSQMHGRLHALGVATSLPFAFATTFLQPSAMPSDELPSTMVLPTLAFFALAFHLVIPILEASARSRVVTIKLFKLEWPTAVATAAFVGTTAFERMMHVTDFVVMAIAYFGITQILYADPRLRAEASGVNDTSSASAGYQTSKKESTTALESLESQYRHVRSTIKTILLNPDSRKIYFFLCLNLAFMFVQMMYGIWTNSLGLISDSIHMFFDCLALGMGLFASVMATWPRNETFTYGYARVETLSGFANGIFLILISIFIVFEAIQRLIDPPEMNTNQLLLVSVAGLGINLVGMFATGHHHHGHSHVMADTLGSVGVIISTLLINRYGWTGFDPIASIFIAVLIFASVVPLVTESGRLLCLDIGVDHEKDVRSALAKLSNIEGLSSYAAARFWPKDPSTMIGSIHVQLAPSPSHDRAHQHGQSRANGNVHNHAAHHANVERVVNRVESILKSGIQGLVDLTIQVEPTEGSDMCTCMVVI
ncbi:putative zinc transporter msc2 [Cystobasidiomycetes sp. EMM_F5]